MRDRCKDDPVAVVGGKRKTGSSVDGFGLEGGLRETRGTRARRIAQGGESRPQLSLTATEDLTGRLELDDVRPRESKTVGQAVRWAFLRKH